MKIKLSFGATLLFMVGLAVLLTIYVAWLIYPLEITWLNLEASVPFSKATIQQNYHILLNYLTNPFHWQLNMPNFPSSPDGLYHFEAVKKLFHLAQGLTLLLVPAVIYFYKKVIKKGFKHLFAKGFLVMALIPIIIGGLVGLIGFNSFFVLFHQVLFPGDSTWIFHPDLDSVILILPEQYFLHCFLLFFGFYELLMLGSYLLTKNKKPV